MKTIAELKQLSNELVQIENEQSLTQVEQLNAYCINVIRTSLNNVSQQNLIDRFVTIAFLLPLLDDKHKTTSIGNVDKFDGIIDLRNVDMKIYNMANVCKSLEIFKSEGFSVQQVKDFCVPYTKFTVSW